MIATCNPFGLSLCIAKLLNGTILLCTVKLPRKKGVYARVAAKPWSKLEADSAVLPFAASRTTCSIVPLQYLHHLCLFQYAQVPAEIAVCKSTQLFEISERKSLGIGKQRRQNAEARTLVNHPIQSFVREAAFTRSP